MDDSWGKFWERLIIDAVALLVVGFVLQGLWFALGSALTGWKPDLEPSFGKASGRFLAIWLLALVVGLIVGVKRAWDAKAA